MLRVMLTLCLIATCAHAAEPLRVDADFPGGNGRIERIEGNTVFVRQDLRDTQGDWFYWYFRIRGAAGRTLRIQFAGDVFPARGPAASIDGGATWRWLGRSAVKDNAFSFAIPQGAKDVRFSMTIPYVQSDLDRFLAKHEGKIERKVLCRTKAGREAELLRVGRLDAPRHRVLVVARHHACESIASFVMEGIIEQVLADDEEGRWLRGNVEFLLVPFVDKDGVEAGDQGKNRRPHDHNRDYADPSLHPTVAAIRQRIPAWSEGKLRLALDLHCPWIRGGRNETIFFVNGPDERNAVNMAAFCKLLEQSRRGPLVYKAEDNMPFGKEWNADPNSPSFGRWAAALDGIRFAGTIETPYATASGGEITAEPARAFGRDVARAIAAYMK